MDERERDGGRAERGGSRRGSCWTMSTASQASRSGPIDSKRVCSTLKSRSLLPFLSLPSTLPSHHSFSLSLIPSTFYLSFVCTDGRARGRSCSSLRSCKCKRCNEGGHGPANPKSPFPRYKASFPFFGFDPPHGETSRRCHSV